MSEILLHTLDSLKQSPGSLPLMQCQEMVKDIKHDSTKLEKERRDKLEKYKREQAKKPQANNKRKMETVESKRMASMFVSM